MTRVFWMGSLMSAPLFVTFEVINAIDRSDLKIDGIVAEFLNLCSEILQGREEIDKFLMASCRHYIELCHRGGFCSALPSSPPSPHGFIQTYVWYEVLVSGSDVFVFHSGKHIKLRSNSQGGGQTHVWYEV